MSTISHSKHTKSKTTKIYSKGVLVNHTKISINENFPLYCNSLYMCLHYVTMKALKCKTLSTELAHTYTLYYMHAPFTLTTIYLVLTLVGNGRQLNLLRGNFMIENGCLSRAKVKTSYTAKRKLFSKIYILKTFGVQQRLRGQFNLLHAGTRLVTDTQTDRATTITLLHMRAER